MVLVRPWVPPPTSRDAIVTAYRGMGISCLSGVISCRPGVLHGGMDRDVQDFGPYGDHEHVDCRRRRVQSKLTTYGDEAAGRTAQPVGDLHNPGGQSEPHKGSHDQRLGKLEQLR